MDQFIAHMKAEHGFSLVKTVSDPATGSAVVHMRVPYKKLLRVRAQKTRAMLDALFTTAQPDYARVQKLEQDLAFYSDYRNSHFSQFNSWPGNRLLLETIGAVTKQEDELVKRLPLAKRRLVFSQVTKLVNRAGTPYVRLLFSCPVIAGRG